MVYRRAVLQQHARCVVGVPARAHKERCFEIVVQRVRIHARFLRNHSGSVKRRANCQRYKDRVLGIPGALTIVIFLGCLQMLMHI